MINMVINIDADDQYKKKLKKITTNKWNILSNNSHNTQYRDNVLK